jgi:hypothetical protein
MQPVIGKGIKNGDRFNLYKAVVNKKYVPFGKIALL